MSQRAMSRAELVASVAAQSGVTQKDTNAVLTGLISVITETVSAGGSVALPGVGKISSRERAARTLRNPRTGEAVSKPADRAPKMTFAKALKTACNS